MHLTILQPVIYDKGVSADIHQQHLNIIEEAKSLAANMLQMQQQAQVSPS